MPPVNHALLASAAIVGASVVVAAALVLYENPEVRRRADEFRRRIAIALHGFDGSRPQDDTPLFNRPEDADGFLRSRGGVGSNQSAHGPNRSDAGDVGVDGDDETVRRQRAELMYWNAKKLENEAEERSRQNRSRSATPVADVVQLPSGATFDDLLPAAYNTGADVSRAGEGLTQRHRGDGVRGLNPAVYANPFADEWAIDAAESSAPAPAAQARKEDDNLTDIYNVTEPDANRPDASLISVDTVSLPSDKGAATREDPEPAESYATAGQSDRDREAYESVQAWAQSQSESLGVAFYSAPSSPAPERDTSRAVSDSASDNGSGSLVATPEASLAGSGHDVAVDLAEEEVGPASTNFDVMSENSDGGLITPSTWTEVGSVVSESDSAFHAANNSQ